MNYRKTGPIGNAPGAGSGTAASKPQLSKTRATPLPAHQTGTNSQKKETSAFPNPGALGAQGHGGAD
jgi:hypothetical protein